MNALPNVLVTGGTGVLGAAIVAVLRAHDYDVTANFWRDAARARALQNATGCQLARADVREESEVQELFESRDLGAIIHAAGASRDALLLRTSNELWRAQMKVNLDAAFLVTRASLQFLPDGGRLMLISSRVGERGGAGQCAYASAKGATFGLMRAAAAQRRDLKINALCPGYAPSELSENLSEAARATRESQDITRGADASQSLAAMCLWLMKANVSGQIVRPDCRI